ncbi:MAG TPA: 23S rRNA (adenine(2503)-C(2))-methyltransferase RlmN [Solirubrobacteraceae bacterium]|nr:23S rRNA (adenine(2503)-C(2))-methyltransferase RlmN [Solirubrobacteraceae bacterium]
MDLALLERTLAEHGEPGFRAGQVWAWAARGAADYGEMTDLPRSLRDALARELPFSSLTLDRRAEARDGTIKALFQTADRRPLEAVLMRYRSGRRSICISSQSGCPLTCTFCATGSMAFARNLSASEIVDQALYFRRVEGAARRDIRSRPRMSNGALPAPITHCVFMGMGEPLLNLDNVLAACRRLPDLGISHRHTTISTVGWIPGIERLGEQEMPLRLALSVHAADDALRSQLMPVNERYPLRDVVEACRAFYARKRRRVFVEYVMLAGVNDRYEQALALAALLAPSRGGERPIFKINLIPYNRASSPMPYEGSTRESIAAFRDVLQSRGVPCTVRLTRGREIDAACGQLAALAS